MSYVIDQVLVLLESDPGRLVYHMILASSIAGCLLIAANQRDRILQPYQRRIFAGIFALVLLQIAQYVLSGLTWRGLLLLESWLPLLDRFVVLLSTAIIVWLWSFPKPTRLADRLTWGVFYFGVSAATFTAIAWPRLDLTAMTAAAPDGTLITNGSLLDWIFQLASFGLLMIGIITLFKKRPDSWGYGLIMIAMFSAGHLAHLWYLPYGSDYPTFLRLFHLAGFPLLALIPLKEISRTARTAPESLTTSDRTSALLGRPVIEEPHMPEPELDGIEPRLLGPLLDLIDYHSDSHANQLIVTILSEAAGSDYVTLISPPDWDGKNRLLCGYSQVEKRLIEQVDYDPRDLPIFNSCMKMGRVRLLSASSSSPDRQTLAGTFNNEMVGPMLFVPVLSPKEVPLVGIVIASSNEEKYWTSKKQDEIGQLAKFLVYLLSQSQEIASARHELNRARQTALALHGQAHQAFLDRQKLSDTLAVLEENAHLGQTDLEKSSAQFEDRTNLEQVIQHLQIRNQLLQDTLQEERTNADQNIEELRSDLQAALEEIAALNSMFANNRPPAEGADAPEGAEHMEVSAKPEA